MKLHIEAKPGEIRERLADLIRTVEALAERDGDLCKGGPTPDTEADRDLLIPVLREAVEQSGNRVEAIRMKLEDELLKIVAEI